MPAPHPWVPLSQCLVSSAKDPRLPRPRSSAAQVQPSQTFPEPATPGPLSPPAAVWRPHTCRPRHCPPSPHQPLSFLKTEGSKAPVSVAAHSEQCSPVGSWPGPALKATPLCQGLHLNRSGPTNGPLPCSDRTSPRTPPTCPRSRLPGLARRRCSSEPQVPTHRCPLTDAHSQAPSF